MAEQKKSGLGLGILIGTVVGGLAAIFLSPKSGKQNRKEVAKKLNQLKKLFHDKDFEKKVKEIFGEVSEETKNIYIQAKEWLVEELSQMKETIENIDQEKYKKAVNDVMKKVQKVAKKESKELEKLKTQLMKEWSKLQK